MIALDADILLRYFVEDDQAPSRAAIQFMESVLTEAEPGFVPLLALCDLAWSLKRTYRFSRTEIAGAISRLLDARQIEVEHSDLVRRALERPSTGFADAIIHEVGRLNGCTHTVTFDRKFARLEGVELLK